MNDFPLQNPQYCYENLMTQMQYPFIENCIIDNINFSIWPGSERWTIPSSYESGN